LFGNLCTINKVLINVTILAIKLARCWAMPQDL